MKTCLIGAALVAGLAGASAASAQAVEPGLSREIGRAVGQAAVAAERAAADAAIAAREAWRAARQGYAESGGRFAGGGERVMDEDRAIDTCALAAEERGYDQGFRAVVRDVDLIERRPGGWDVGGVIEARRSFRERRPETWGFRCSIRDGRVVNVDIGNNFARR